jgi:hypothetical protein
MRARRPSPKRVYIHIGTPKSGTTYLQANLHENAPSLKKQQGLLYPSQRKGDMFHAMADLRGGVTEWRVNPDRVDGAWARIATRINAFSGASIISQEQLCGASREQVRRMLGDLPDHEHHVVITARSLDLVVPASWQQRVKQGGVLTFGAFRELILDPRSDSRPARGFWGQQDLPAILSRWGEGIPPDHVHVVACPPPGTEPGQLWRRFCSVVGIDPARTVEATERSNVALGITEIELMRRLNLVCRERGLSRVLTPVIRQQVVGEALRRYSSPRPRCPKDLVAVLEEVSRRWIDEIRERGYSVVGDLEELVPVPSDVEYVDPDNVDVAGALDVAVGTIADLLAEVHELRNGSTA